MEATLATQDGLTFLGLKAPSSPHDCATEAQGRRRLPRGRRGRDEAAVAPRPPASLSALRHRGGGDARRRLSPRLPCVPAHDCGGAAAATDRGGGGSQARQAESAQPPPLRPTPPRAATVPPLGACAPQPQPPHRATPGRGPRARGGAVQLQLRPGGSVTRRPSPTAELGRGWPPPTLWRLRRHARLQWQPSLGSRTMARIRRRTPRAPRLPGWEVAPRCRVPEPGTSREVHKARRAHQTPASQQRHKSQNVRGRQHLS